MKPSLRKTLARLISVMGALLIFTFAFVLLRGTLGYSPVSDSSRLASEVIEGIASGETVLRRVESELLWVSHLSDKQLSELASYADAVVQLDVGCSLDSRFCILRADTDKTGIQLRFTESPPAQLPVELPWLGGLVNPANGAVYDLLGRPYRFQGTVIPIAVIEETASTEPN